MAQPRTVNFEYTGIERVDANFAQIAGVLNALGIYFGTGTPEAAVTAPVGSIYRRFDGGAGTSVYIKETGTGNTGWVGK